MIIVDLRYKVVCLLPKDYNCFCKACWESKIWNYKGDSPLKTLQIFYFSVLVKKMYIFILKKNFQGCHLSDFIFSEREFPVPFPLKFLLLTGSILHLSRLFTSSNLNSDFSSLNHVTDNQAVSTTRGKTRPTALSCVITFFFFLKHFSHIL